MNTLAALKTQKLRYLENTKIQLGCKKNGEGVTILMIMQLIGFEAN